MMMMVMMMMKVDADDDDDDDDDDGNDDAERTRTGPHAARSDLEHRVNYNAKISKVQSSTGECFVQALCSTKYYWEVLCASFVVQSSTGECFVQGLQYKVVLGSTLCKLCSAK